MIYSKHQGVLVFDSKHAYFLQKVFRKDKRDTFDIGSGTSHKDHEVLFSCKQDCEQAYTMKIQIHKFFFLFLCYLLSC